MDNSLIYYPENKQPQEEEGRWVGAVLAVVATVAGGVMNYDQQEKAKKMQDEQIRAQERAAKEARELEEMRQRFEREKMEAEKQAKIQEEAQRKENFKRKLPYWIGGGVLGFVVLIIIIVLATTKPAK